MHLCARCQQNVYRPKGQCMMLAIPFDRWALRTGQHRLGVQPRAGDSPLAHGKQDGPPSRVQGSAHPLVARLHALLQGRDKLGP